MLLYTATTTTRNVVRDNSSLFLAYMAHVGRAVRSLFKVLEYLLADVMYGLVFNRLKGGSG